MMAAKVQNLCLALGVVVLIVLLEQMGKDFMLLNFIWRTGCVLIVILLLLQVCLP
jgi:hypothetical protein